MAGSSNSNSYGFFGQGYWGRKVFWEKVPVQHRNLDSYGYLENLLKTWGDECESLLQKIYNLPNQREPYLVRARDEEAEWFYFTAALNYEDSYWGNVIRLIGEKDYDSMPNHDEDNIPTSDEDELEQWWGWWPYKPISNIARWWNTSWNDASYDVVRVRTRNMDWSYTPYRANSSLGNEVWLKGGDLRIFFDYLSDGVTWRSDWTSIGNGDGTNSPSVEFPYLPVRIEYNSTGSSPWLVSNAKLKININLTSGGEYYYLYDAPDLSLTEYGNLYPQAVLASNSGSTISFSKSSNLVTISDTSGLFTSGMIGKTIRIIGTNSNDGVFIVLYYIDSDNLTYVNANGATEIGAVSNYWEVGNGEINTTTSFGTINYQTGKIDLSISGDTVVNESDILAKWSVRGYYLPFYPSRIIDYLAKDFGFDNDKNDPEDVQRSTIANITKYYGLKATQDSYRIRGEISLFKVVAKAFWYVCDSTFWNSLSIDRKFIHNGKLYTDIEPRKIKFDDIASDQQLYDPDTSSWQPISDNELMYEDNSSDGYSIGLAYALDVGQGYYGYIAPSPHPSSGVLRNSLAIISSDLLTDSEAAAYGLLSGYRVVLSMMRCQEYAFNWNKGYFGITEYDKSSSIPPGVDDAVFWIDDVEIPWIVTDNIWQANTVYSIGEYVYSTIRDAYQCTTGGTSGAIEPSWDTTVGNTTNDNTVVWARVSDTGYDADEEWGEWTVIVGVGKDEDGNPYDGPSVGRSDIIAVSQIDKKFTISGNHTSVIESGKKITVLRSTGNNGVYTVMYVNLSGSDTVLTVYEVIPSSISDGELGWIDAAIRYYPAVDTGDCCYCKSYKMRVEIEPTDEAYSYYDTNEKLDNAISRMKNKIYTPSDTNLYNIRSTLVPIHARVVDWAIIKTWTLDNVSNSNTITEILNYEFLADSISSISGIDTLNKIITIIGNKKSLLVSGDTINVRNSTGNDGEYTVVSVELNDNNEDTDITVLESLSSFVADGSLYLKPSKILMTVDQRGDMGAAETHRMRLYDESDSIVWTVTQGTGISDADTWYNVVTDIDITADIGNNSPAKIEATDLSGMSYGDVRFTFKVSKYLR